MAGGRRRISVELVAVTGIAALGLILFRWSADGCFGGFAGWLVPVIFLYLPLLAVMAGDRDFADLGFRRPRGAAVLLDLFFLVFVILPFFLVSWWAFMKYGMGMKYRFRLPPDLVSLVLWQLAGVALPEEIFFRGYVQSRLNRLFQTRRRLAGAAVGPGLFLAALLFALAHFLSEPRAPRLLVFFPGLLFGFFRERENSLLGPFLAHAICNSFFLAAQAGL